MAPPAVSGCVICFNNAATIATTLQSMRAQTVPVSDMVVVDDGSTDRSADVAGAAGARVVRHAVNRGRGAARARAVSEAHGDLVLCVDATMTIPQNFVATLAPWFDDSRVAAVCAPIDDPHPLGLVRRWRARHLFRTGAAVGVSHQASLNTGGSVLRRSAVLEVGNFDPAFTHREDADLGRRLLAHGYDVVFDRRIAASSTTGNSLPQVLERYWRWNMSADESISWRDYLKDIAYSVRVMARHDYREGDLAAIPISLATPHYRAWKTWRQRNQPQAGQRSQ
ncbi:unnamed protein product [uncultured bacterium]|nr:unnamed protein product [uncultured bacterium]